MSGAVNKRWWAISDGSWLSKGAVWSAKVT